LSLLPPSVPVHPSFLSELSRSVSAILGQPFTFTVRASGFPKPAVTWFHEGNNISSSSLYEFTHEKEEFSLVIREIRPEHGGEYTCTVSNRFGQATYRAVPPSFPKALQRVAQAVGGAAVLECRVAGSQPLTVSWFKDGREITKHERFSAEFNENTAVLTIRGLTLNDAGEFSCRAQNQAGTSQTSSELCVTGTWFSSAPLVVRWFKEQREVFPSPKASIRGEVRGEGSWSSLELHTVRTVDSGSYTCQVSNEGGKTLCSSTLSVQGV
uniref:Ig-like domain-containing protein n=1 Tax=Periophthalmus magnuspinnatus TaxID=409849 RepID=A0A3B4ACT2_9GOBI